MKIYTKTGDKGTTSLIYGERVSKNDIRVEAYGTCDEANSLIGQGASFLHDTAFDGKDKVLELLHNVQTILFHVGAELATPTGRAVAWKLESKHIEDMEKAIDQLDEDLPQLKNFILPGGHPAGASLHIARTVVRRAERLAVGIGEEVNPLVLSYLNRLSDFLFVVARYINTKTGYSEKNLHQV